MPSTYGSSVKRIKVPLSRHPQCLRFPLEWSNNYLSISRSGWRLNTVGPFFSFLRSTAQSFIGIERLSVITVKIMAPPGTRWLFLCGHPFQFRPHGARALPSEKLPLCHLQYGKERPVHKWLLPNDPRKCSPTQKHSSPLQKIEEYGSQWFPKMRTEIDYHRESRIGANGKSYTDADNTGDSTAESCTLWAHLASQIATLPLRGPPISLREIFGM